MERPDSFSPSEKHKLIGRLLEEIKLKNTPTGLEGLIC